MERDAGKSAMPCRSDEVVIDRGAIRHCGYDHAGNPVIEGCCRIEHDETAKSPRLLSPRHKASALTLMSSRHRLESNDEGANAKRRRVDNSAQHDSAPASDTTAQFAYNVPDCSPVREALIDRVNEGSLVEMDSVLSSHLKFQPSTSTTALLHSSIGLLAAWIKMDQSSAQLAAEGIDLLTQVLTIPSPLESLASTSPCLVGHEAARDVGDECLDDRNPANAALTLVSSCSTQIEVLRQINADEARFERIQRDAVLAEDIATARVCSVLHRLIEEIPRYNRSIEAANEENNVLGQDIDALFVSRRDEFIRGGCGKGLAAVRSNSSIYLSEDVDIVAMLHQIKTNDARVQRDQTKLSVTQRAVSFYESARDLARELRDLLNHEIQVRFPNQSFAFHCALV